MALTPEDVLNKKFAIIKFRDGYDLDQVDEFLDIIVEDIRERDQQLVSLKQQLDTATAEVETLKAQLKKTKKGGGQAATTEQNDAELQAAYAEISSLKAQLAEANAEAEQAESEQPASARTIVVDAGQAATPHLPGHANAAHGGVLGSDADAVKSSAMLQLALELHDKHVHEGEAKRDLLIFNAEQKAAEMMTEAEQKRNEVLQKLKVESTELREVIKELRDFEGEYRSTLRSYIQSQLRNLDGSPEPDGAPAGLD